MYIRNWDLCTPEDSNMFQTKSTATRSTPLASVYVSAGWRGVTPALLCERFLKLNHEHLSRRRSGGADVPSRYGELLERGRRAGRGISRPAPAPHQKLLFRKKPGAEGRGNPVGFLARREGQGPLGKIQETMNSAFAKGIVT
jgi:hypothetical protein